MLKLVSENLEFEKDGVVYSIKYPTMKQVKNFVKAQRVSETEDGKLEEMKNYMVGLGLPEDIYDGLTSNHIAMIATELNKEKKK